MSRGSSHLAPEKQAVTSVVKAADGIRRYFQQVLEPWGLTLQQFNVLRILRGAGEDGLPTLEVGHRMVEKTPGVTRLLDRLEEKGLVCRERCRPDRRQVLCHVTEKALDLLAELDDPIDEADRACVADLSRTEQLQLAALASRTGP
jgi:DNA-binding MarR family transcriptional regulator